MESHPDHIERDEVEAMLAVRQEKGDDMTPALVDSMADRIERVVEQRMAAEHHRLQNQKPTSVTPAARVSVAIVSVVMAIPLTAISASTVGLAGMLAVWVGLVAINIALGFRRGDDS